MMRTGVHFVVVIAVLGFSQQPSRSIGADDKESQELRILAESTLTSARKDSNLGKDFTDVDVRKTFGQDQNVVAVLLRINYRGEEIREIGVSVSYDRNTKVFLVKTLSADHADAKLIKKLLKL